MSKFRPPEKFNHLATDSDPEPTSVLIHRCGYVSKCKARDSLAHATLIAEKVDGSGVCPRPSERRSRRSLNRG
jgi:hypothetical protein